jgi:predicted TIM-barrel fold metal-dependent hydrolase
MIIDAHGHLNWHGHNTDKMVKNLDQHGIDKMWALTWEAGLPVERAEASMYAACVDPRHSANPWLSLGDVVEGALRYPDRLIPFFAPHPKQEHALEKLKAAVEIHGIRGVGEWKFRVPLDDPDCVRIFRYAGKQKLPVVIHMDAPRLPPSDPEAWCHAWYGGDAAQLQRALQQAPETIILGHGPGFWRYVTGKEPDIKTCYLNGPADYADGGRLIELLESYPNLYCDLSAGSGLFGLQCFPDGGKNFLTTYQDRALFARDYFDARLRDHIESLGLEETARAKILGGNALRLVPL